MTAANGSGSGRTGRALAFAASFGIAAAALGAMGGSAALHAQAGPEGPGGQDAPPLILDAERKAEFTTNRGTWMSLDVSPDGQTIVFDLLGDLYTIPIEGGEATQITEGMAFDVQPRFSPDGESIVFVSDRSGGENVWTMRLDFTDTTQVSRGNTSSYLSPEWMPDGEHIVVSRGGGTIGSIAKLVLFDVRRRSPLPIVSQPQSFRTLGAAPTPDGRYIWFAGRSGNWQYNALFPQYQLYRYDRETGDQLRMTGRYGSAFRPAISPDGRWLVYGSRENTQTGLRRRDLQTGDEDWLAYPVQRDDIESIATLDVLPGFAFTPDSRAVIYTYDGQIWRVPIEGGDPVNIPFTVDVELGIGPEVKFAYDVDDDEDVVAKQIRHPVASPDGDLLAFTAFDRLWVKRMPDGEPRRLTDAAVGEYHPVWSPDGQWVAFVTWNDAEGGHIARALADGTGTVERLTRSPALYYNLAWSPDGQRIAATRGAARELMAAPDIFFGPLGGQFVWVPATGGDATLIAPTGNRDNLHFRADEPDRLYAYSGGEGLVSFRWDGTDVKRHLSVRGAPTPGGPPGAPPPPASLVKISPDGERIAAQVGNHLYAADFPPLTGTPPTLSVGNPDGAPVEVTQLTEVGGEFPSWTADGERLHWAIGNALFTYDFARVEAIEDSTIMDAREKALESLRVQAIIDSLQETRAHVDSLREADEVVPDSLRDRLRGLIADSVAARADSLMREADEARERARRILERADSLRTGADTLEVEEDTYKPDERRIRVTLPRDIPRGSIVLRGGRVVTMDEHEIIENGDVVITDNRIVAVGPTGEVEVPDGAEIVDVSGKTITPGFVDTHYHAQWLVPEIHVNQVWQYLTNLAYGVTTTRDPQTSSTDILSYGDRVEIGDMVGPRIFSTGPGVFWSEPVRDTAHAKDILRRYSDYYDTKTLKMYLSGNRQQRQWIIKAARELELMPTTEGGLDFKLDMTHAIDGYSGIEHSLPITQIQNDVVELFKASQTTNSPTLLVSYGGPFGENYYYTKGGVHGNDKLRRFAPHASVDARTRRRGPGAGGSPGQGGWFLDEEYVFPQHAEFIKRLVENGARAGVGSHGQLQGLGYHWELWATGSGGLSNHDALRVATIYGAEAIGFGDDLGSIQEGKLADILVFDSDPLEDLENSVDILYVMKNGRLYEAESLDEIWPRQRPLPAPPWRDSDPANVAAGIRDSN